RVTIAAVIASTSFSMTSPLERTLVNTALIDDWIGDVQRMTEASTTKVSQAKRARRTLVPWPYAERPWSDRDDGDHSTSAQRTGGEPRLLPRGQPRLHSLVPTCHAVGHVAPQCHPDRHAPADPAAPLVDLPARGVPGPPGGRAGGRLAAVSGAGAVRDELQRSAARRRAGPALQRCPRALRHAASDRRL